MDVGTQRSSDLGVASGGHEGRYTPRRPEETTLYALVERGLGPFLERREALGRPVPSFVERDLRAYLRCGRLEHGLCRWKCDDCGHEMAVAFSCKSRGFCPSCLGRRMADTAAHLVDRVLPAVPVRQWVLTLPFGLRLLCAFRPEVLSLVVRAWTRAVFSLYRRRARMLGFGRGQCGAVTAIQRAGSACELNVHFHTLVLDGVYVVEDSGTLGFRPFPAPTRAQLDQVVRAVARKVRRALRRAGLEDEAALPDSAAAEPELAALVGESVAFPRDRVVEPEHARPAGDAHTVASAEGFNLHAGVAVSALDRAGRERLCKYLLRPPLSDDRLRLRDDGRVELRLKTAWRDGTVALLLTPEQLVARLAALVPRPEKNLIRYHGVLAPAARDRAQVVPPRTAPAESGGGRTETSARNRSPNRTGRYLLWAELLRRVFRAEVERCPRCTGRMRLICAVLDGHSLARYLRALRAVAPDERARPPPALVQVVVAPAS